MKLLIILLICFLSFLSGGVKHKNDLQRNNLKGRVKSTTELWYSVNAKTEKLEGLPEKTINTYDSVGNLISTTIYAEDGKLLDKDYLTYDASKPRIIEKSFDAGDSLSVMEITKLDYNFNSAFANSYYRGKSLRSIILYRYDSSGNEIEEKDCSPSLIIASAKYDSTGKFVGTSEDPYPMDKDSMTDAGNIDSTWQSSEWKYKYNTLGEQVEEDSYLNDATKMGYKTVYKYDKMGNRVEVSGYEEPGNKLHGRYDCKYEDYDSKGNWQKMVRSHNNVLEGITKRIIEYYP